MTRSLIRSRFLIFIYWLLFFSIWAPPALAELTVTCPEGQTYFAIFDLCLDFSNAMSLLVTWSLTFGSVTALIKFGIGAMQMATATGNPTKLENARSTLTDAILGILIIAGAWATLAYAASTLPDQWKIHLFFFPNA